LSIEIQLLIKRRIEELENGAENTNFVHHTKVQKVLKTYLSAFTQ